MAANNVMTWEYLDFTGAESNRATDILAVARQI
jgi:hypothetical protein